MTEFDQIQGTARQILDPWLTANGRRGVRLMIRSSGPNCMANSNEVPFPIPLKSFVLGLNP